MTYKETISIASHTVTAGVQIDADGEHMTSMSVWRTPRCLVNEVTIKMLPGQVKELITALQGALDRPFTDV